MARKDMQQQTRTRQERARRRLLGAAAHEADTLRIQYDNTGDGFDAFKVSEMRDLYGANQITQHSKVSALHRLRDAFLNPFTGILFVLSCISLLSKDIPAVAIVMTMILISGLLRFIQELRSGNAAERLSEMVETTADVLRVCEGRAAPGACEIPIDEIVVGDLVRLAAGDIIPADVRILQAKDLFVSQSSLTGESEPVEKFATAVATSAAEGGDAPLDLPNLAFLGSTVVAGSATAIVLAVGDDTELGRIAGMLQEKAPPTSFEKGVSSVSWLLIRFMLVMVPVVLLLNGFTKGDWLEALLFALSVAVGLTPEMLPMIVSANLARGAVSMARGQVIVKGLNAIQDFGAMDVLCTDKTGTLTQDKVVLEYHLDVHGNLDTRVLRHAYLNSYWQTGLKNLMDVSIIERAREEGVAAPDDAYRKVDEIPFDFSRRRMSVVVEDRNGKTQMITKGAIEEMLSISAFVEYGGRVEPMTEALRREVMDTCVRYNADGLRVLGVSQKTDPSPEGTFSVADEAGMVLIGYLAFLDPPKESAAKAVAALRARGVGVKVLTGDNDAVTKSICRQVGIDAGHTLLGSDVEGMDDDALRQAAGRTVVFAKLSPVQKQRVVSVLRADGHTVGFLGDGVNDAAAMKAADVGVSVDTAVDIAKESADIILMEKDLTVLEKGVATGRRVYA
ncbi:MAG: magnesium-translocating P-type ATPase, partial [Clostridiales Family XIII bacterium]|nr:magnesium-translocating P-type ATPase [Clostridiales Family XIII bacterium]